MKIENSNGKQLNKIDFLSCYLSIEFEKKTLFMQNESKGKKIISNLFAFENRFSIANDKTFKSKEASMGER